MEGPSLYLAAVQLAPFIGKTILTVHGNTKIGKERLLNQKVTSIFSHGKHLYIQCKTFALRTHFLLWGSFEATINDIKVTGDYPKKLRTPRLSLTFENGHLELYSCSIKFIESSNAKALCNYETDVMSDFFDQKKVFKEIKRLKNSEIADVLLDQAIFTGVGNIIKNETLFITKTSPLKKVEEISDKKLKEIIKVAKNFSIQFYKWHKNFELKKHYQIYRQSFCKQCSSKIIKKKTGVRKRFSYICPNC